MSYTSPNWKSSILITIDMQNDFVLPDAPAKIVGTIEVLPNLKLLLEAYHKHRLPILHVIRLYLKDGSNVDLCRKEIIEQGAVIAAPGTEGAELASVLRCTDYTSLNAEKLLQGEFQAVGEKEWLMYKPRWGAFYNTHLESFLRSREIDTLLFTGCNFPNCPRTSMYEASERDFRVAMIPDSMSQVYEKGIEEMHQIGVHIYKLQEVIDQLEDT